MGRSVGRRYGGIGHGHRVEHRRERRAWTSLHRCLLEDCHEVIAFGFVPSMRRPDVTHQNGRSEISTSAGRSPSTHDDRSRMVLGQSFPYRAAMKNHEGLPPPRLKIADDALEVPARNRDAVGTTDYHRDCLTIVHEQLVCQSAGTAVVALFIPPSSNSHGAADGRSREK